MLNVQRSGLSLLRGCGGSEQCKRSRERGRMFRTTPQVSKQQLSWWGCPRTSSSHRCAQEPAVPTPVLAAQPEMSSFYGKLPFFLNFPKVAVFLSTSQSRLLQLPSSARAVCLGAQLLSIRSDICQFDPWVGESEVIGNADKI